MRTKKNCETPTGVGGPCALSSPNKSAKAAKTHGYASHLIAARPFGVLRVQDLSNLSIVVAEPVSRTFFFFPSALRSRRCRRTSGETRSPLDLLGRPRTAASVRPSFPIAGKRHLTQTGEDLPTNERQRLSEARTLRIVARTRDRCQRLTLRHPTARIAESILTALTRAMSSAGERSPRKKISKRT